MIIVGVDTGGTFTDFVAFDGRVVRVHKVLSTPEAPERAILSGLRALGIDFETARIVHGSTVATNTVLEGKGAHTLFVANHGFADTLTIGRQARVALYDLKPSRVPPPVAAEDCLETGGRIGADGTVVEPLDDEQLAELLAAIEARRPEAVAVSLLFSFRDDRFERAIAERLPDNVFVSLSSEVLPEHREYERGMATWLNAYTGPRMARYLDRLTSAVAPAPLGVMQSAGVTADPEFASRHAVNLLLSGPAGGLLGARHVGSSAGCERLLTFDMGGTSTDVALIDGALGLTSEGHIGRFPVAVPMVDMHTIGAGGGSIARVDVAGVLHVGPESAGAQPGPACYGQGGRQPTVTDANVVLGRLPATLALGGDLQLDPDAARAALTRLGEALGGVGATAAARGVIDMVNEHMRQALRVISVQRGIDAREFTLVSFGGAGGLHVCALADGMGMRRALVPAAAGVLSALGMVVARPGRRLSRTLRQPLDAVEEGALEGLFESVAAPGLAALAREGHDAAGIERRYSVDVCYRGQSFALELPWRDRAVVAEAFHAAHAARYGHRLDAPLELVTLRVALDAGEVVTTSGRVSSSASSGAAHEGGVYRREALSVGTIIAGPAVIADTIATTFVDVGWRAVADADGNLLLER